ncbi:hypothetical protein NLG97_g5964 [Lecanicillium saksenae]|uniref:Uncharacterized protein n=1 Tax=Lecanicillium saksenae TaxID=468837 RepID=A0ACC1QS49_9HYPO|nr:hypothetical protein NLG97_g5964 [Lecanicillium saksenae]
MTAVAKNVHKLQVDPTYAGYSPAQQNGNGTAPSTTTVAASRGASWAVVALERCAIVQQDDAPLRHDATAAM